MKYWAPILFLILPGLAYPSELAVAPVVDASALPSLGSTWQKTNPFRDLSVAREIGGVTFNQSCARCHGPDANNAGYPAPDLRQLDRACRRIGDAKIKAHCMADNDAFFSKSVREGKVIVGITHMPPWKDALSQELTWAIQVFIESQKEAPTKK
jgi:mono/diheme cytochrome c family protein